MRRLRIGRSDTNEIVIPDASVSRQHAELVELGGGRFSLKDLGSTFGTHVWQNQAWVPAAETEIRADTVIRFGEFRTTLFDVVGAVERAALGLAPPAAPMPTPLVEKSPPPPAAAPPAAAPTPPAPTPATPPPSASATPAPAPAAPPPPAATPPALPPAPRTRQSPPPAEPPPAEPPRAEPPAAPAPASATPPPPRVAARPRRTATERQRNAMRLGLIGVGSIFLFAIVAVIVIFAFGDANPPLRRDDRADAGAGQRKFLDSCTKEWKVEERRCRCFLAAAGPNLQPDDYDDFADVVEAYLSGDSDRSESAVQRVTEKRGVHASSRISTAFKGVVRDCQ